MREENISTHGRHGGVGCEREKREREREKKQPYVNTWAAVETELPRVRKTGWTTARHGGVGWGDTVRLQVLGLRIMKRKETHARY